MLYTDPFGLCPIAKDGVPCTLTKAGAGVVGGALTGALIGATGGTLVVPGVGTIAGGGSGAVVGGTVGLVAGGLVGAAQDATAVSGALVQFSERGAGRVKEWITALVISLGGGKETHEIKQPPPAEAEDKRKKKDQNEAHSEE